MPFGMKNAPSVFQREMQRVLRDRLGKGVLVFIDDILIYTATVEEHELLVRWVLQRLCEAIMLTRTSVTSFRVRCPSSATSSARRESPSSSIR